MRIVSSQLKLTSNRSYFENHSKTENLKVFIGKNGNQAKGKDALIEISERSRQLLRESMISKNTTKVDGEKEITYELSDKDKLKIDLLEAFLRKLTGKDIKFIRPKKIEFENAEAIDLSKQNSQQPASVGWGLSYDYKEVYHEVEKVSFNASGIIKTADGKEISIDLSLSMSREFISSKELHISAGDAAKIDPLVINFAGSSVDLTDKKFSFDLDSDGSLDQISFVRKGSGFLSIDTNSDGIINDGSELFGPKSGDGFKDLSIYDEDKNGWIDESDSIYEKLRIWTKDSEGNDTLFALGQKGIGAIYLGNVATDFNLNNQSNDSLGQIRKTGIFLRENGTAGTIQHVDLVI